MKGLFYGWKLVIVTIVILFVAYGIRGSFGLFIRPLCSEFSSSRGAFSFAFTLSLITYGVSSPLIGRLTDKFSPRLSVSIGGALIGLSMFLLSTATSLRQFYIYYGIIFGIGLSGIWPSCTSTINRFFVRKRGLANGIASSGISLGYFMTLGAAYSVEFLGWRQTFVVMGFLSFLCVTLLGGIFMRRDPESMGLLPDGEAVALNAPLNGRSSALRGLAPVEAIKKAEFWLVAALFSFTVAATYMLIIYLVPFVEDMGLGRRSEAAAALSLLGLISIVGRLGGGWLADRVGKLKTLTVSSVTVIVSLISLIFVRDIRALYLIIVLFSFGYGIYPPLIGPLVADYCGRKNLSTIYGMINIFIALAEGLGPLFAGVVYDLTKSYFFTFLSGVLLEALALGVIFILQRRPKVEGWD